jgi:hypothetical protein
MRYISTLYNCDSYGRGWWRLLLGVVPFASGEIEGKSPYGK